jgi:putative ABC transport system ATP-binding protein
LIFTLAQQNIQSNLETILNISNLNKTYKSAGRTLTVLDNINFAIAAGSTNAIVGPSGSGKTTLAWALRRAG